MIFVAVAVVARLSGLTLTARSLRRDSVDFSVRTSTDRVVGGNRMPFETVYEGELMIEICAILMSLNR